MCKISTHIHPPLVADHRVLCGGDNVSPLPNLISDQKIVDDGTTVNDKAAHLFSGFL